MKILYFARLKELIGKSEDTVSIIKEKKIYQIIDDLKKRNKKYKSAFDEIENLQYAVNCEYVKDNSFVNNNDELAIFPPVTGG